MLALQCSDIQDGHLSISRSLSQTKAGLKFKRTKNGKARVITLPGLQLPPWKNTENSRPSFAISLGRITKAT